MGLMLAKEANLTPSQNRDAKRGTSAASRDSILWIVQDMPWPRSRWMGLNMKRFRELRKIPGGSKRMATFFRENLDRPIHRSVLLALLHDKDDPMRRIRGNSGARDILPREGIALLSKYDRPLLAALGLTIEDDEFIALRPETPEQIEILRNAGKIV
jgi:hypothetical protein